MRITSSSMLSKTDVDRMVAEAASHAVEDRARREAIEARNSAEQGAYSAERTLRELGDKVEPGERAGAEQAIADLRTALKGSDEARVKEVFADLQNRMSRIGAAAYAAPERPEDMTGPGPGAASADEPDTVEGEFHEVN